MSADGLNDRGESGASAFAKASADCFRFGIPLLAFAREGTALPGNKKSGWLTHTRRISLKSVLILRVVAGRHRVERFYWGKCHGQGENQRL